MIIQNKVAGANVDYMIATINSLIIGVINTLMNVPKPMTTKKRNLRIIQFVLLFLFTAGSIHNATGQTADIFIQVGDTTINLNDVDLKKGMKIQGKQFVKKGDDGRIINYKTSFKVFASPERDFYAVVFNKTSGYKGSYYSGFNVELKYFNKNGELLFEKKFTGFSLYLCYISVNNKVVAFSRTNEDYEGYDFYKSDGTLIKEYSTSAKLYVGPLHRNFFICNVMYNCNGANTFDHIDESGNIEEVVFPKGFFRGISFSPQENYYIVYLGDDILLYNINHELIWRIPKSNMGTVNITWDEKSYMIRNYRNKAIEIKNLFNHKLIYSIESVKYHDNYFPIYRWNIIDSNFYAIGRNDSIYIYNFYDADGAIIQTETVPVIKRTKPYKVRKQGDKFIIEPRKRNL